jgi:alpha-N-arabinofuranosidase
MRDKAAVSFVGRRQLDMSVAASMALEFSPAREGEAAGLALVQSEDYHYRLELTLSRGASSVRLVAAEGGADRVLAQRELGDGCAPGTGGPFAKRRVVISVVARAQDLTFAFGPRAGSLETLAAGIDGRILSTERAGGFVGTVIGAFASGNGKASQNVADVDWFEYRAL